jgi:hypothetical protein
MQCDAVNGANDITINYESSPGLREAFSRKNPGDTCKFELEIQANEIGKSEMKGKIKVITLEEHDEDDKKKEVKPDANEPAVIKMEVDSGEKIELSPSAGY